MSRKKKKQLGEIPIFRELMRRLVRLSPEELEKAVAQGLEYIKEEQAKIDERRRRIRAERAGKIQVVPRKNPNEKAEKNH